ncbi:exosporium protein C [Cohnella lupini]|uniref:Exosporium protein C n=1 Tax=Cohnella lupini TaxID=1294267 RepID=A0A3D9I958_9BACL|nr:exosporium protein C [Cohnella lupini]RED58079.1 hypothetical protein DFP95_109116 [Cohnella lupini]
MTKSVFYNATVVTPITGGVLIPIPQTPTGLGVATVIVDVPNIVPRFVEIIATVGIQGIAGTGSYLFRIFRGTTEIYYSRVGIESAVEEFALNSIQHIDANATPGSHAYTLSVEKITAALSASVIGPIEIRASVYA